MVSPIILFCFLVAWSWALALEKGGILHKRIALNIIKNYRNIPEQSDFGDFMIATAALSNVDQQYALTHGVMLPDCHVRYWNYWQ